MGHSKVRSINGNAYREALGLVGEDRSGKLLFYSKKSLKETFLFRRPKVRFGPKAAILEIRGSQSFAADKTLNYVNRRAQIITEQALSWFDGHHRNLSNGAL